MHTLFMPTAQTATDTDTDTATYTMGWVPSFRVGRSSHRGAKRICSTRDEAARAASELDAKPGERKWGATTIIEVVVGERLRIVGEIGEGVDWLETEAQIEETAAVLRWTAAVAASKCNSAAMMRCRGYLDGLPVGGWAETVQAIERIRDDLPSRLVRAYKIEDFIRATYFLRDNHYVAR